ncbi:tRNA (guanosine(18)-2'-O)-methyltransferase TrmH [Desulfatiferula olefinivorans]
MTPERFEKIREVLSRRQMDLTVLMEHVGTPHNLAAIARTCDAVGIFEAHAVTDMTRIELRQRAAAGSRKWVNIRTHGSLEGAIDTLKERGMQILCAHFDDASVDFRAVDYTRPTAIVLGAELEGISGEALSRSDGSIMVPMLGMIQALNVSVAGALILYEAQRQRMAAGLYDTRHMDEATFARLLFEWGYPRLAPFYRKKKRPYPALDERGAIIGSAGAASR